MNSIFEKDKIAVLRKLADNKKNITKLFSEQQILL